MILYNHQQRVALTEADKTLLNEEMEPSSNKEFALKRLHTREHTSLAVLNLCQHLKEV